MRYALVLAMVLVTSPALADSIRYIVASPQKPKADYPIWRSRYDAEMCGLAVLRNRDIKKYCEDGLGPDMPATLGVGAPGAEVELIEGGACGRDLVQIRLLDGPHKGAAGCITGQALSSRRPNTPTATPRPAPDWCKADNVVWQGDRCVEKK